MTGSTAITIGALVVLAIVTGAIIARGSRAEPPARRPDTQQVYVMYPDRFMARWFGPSKVGISSNVDRRRATFATANPDEIIVYRTFTVADASAVESAAHALLDPIHRRGEWYNASPARAARAVRIVSGQTERGPLPYVRRGWLTLEMRVRARIAAE